MSIYEEQEPSKVEKKRFLLVTGIMLVLVITTGVLFYMSITKDRNTDDLGRDVYTLSSSEVASVQKTSTRFVEIMGNFGLNPEGVTLDEFVATMTDPTALADKTTGRNDTTFKAEDLLAKENRVYEDFIRENDYLIYSVRASDINADVNKNGYRKGGRVFTVSEVTFNSTTSVFQQDPGSQNSRDWIEEISHYKMDFKITFVKEKGKWKIYEIGSFPNTQQVAFRNGDWGITADETKRITQ